jgi:hypothetical protein
MWPTMTGGQVIEVANFSFHCIPNSGMIYLITALSTESYAC